MRLQVIPGETLFPPGKPPSRTSKSKGRGGGCLSRVVHQKQLQGNEFHGTSQAMDAQGPCQQHRACGQDLVEPFRPHGSSPNKLQCLQHQRQDLVPLPLPGVPSCKETPATAHQSLGCFPEQVRGQKIRIAGGLQAGGQTPHRAAVRGIAYRRQAHGFAAPLQSQRSMERKKEEGKENKIEISSIGKICSNSPAGVLQPLLQEIPVRVLQRKTTRRNT